MPASSNRQRSMRCSPRYDTCSLLPANRIARDRRASSVPRAIAHFGTNEPTSAGSALATQNNGTSSCVRLPGRAEYSSIDDARVNSGVFADRVGAAHPSCLGLTDLWKVARTLASRLTSVTGSRSGGVASGKGCGCMSRQPERRRKRSDDELRKQRQEIERQWQELQDRRRGTPSRKRRRL
jgi:hypothetical protein